MNKPEFVRKGKLIAESNYWDWLGEIKHQIHEAQYEAMKAVNTTIIKLYWEIGRSIAEKQAEGWGKSVVEQLSRDIQIEFPQIKGFGSRNLWYMMQFYIEYQGDEKLQPLVAEISWAKHLVIMTKCKDSLERQFYILATKKFGWTKNVLIHQIEQKSYEKYLIGQTNFDKTLPGKIRNQAALAIKDDYFIGYGELGDNHSEYELEQSIINNISSFLAEFGSDVMFAGNQYRLEVGGGNSYIPVWATKEEAEANIGDDWANYTVATMEIAEFITWTRELGSDNVGIAISTGTEGQIFPIPSNIMRQMFGGQDKSDRELVGEEFYDEEWAEPMPEDFEDE